MTASGAKAAYRWIGLLLLAGLAMGGFHLGGSSRAEIRSVIGRLKALGVRKVAPSHCTGETAREMFRAEWGEDFVEGGLGAAIDVPM